MSRSNEELSELVARAKAGQAEAITDLYDEYAPEIYRYALTLVKDQDKAEDILSEAFLRAWTHLPSFEGRNFRAYLYTIARNYAFDVMRKENRFQPLTEEPEELAKRGDVLKNAITNENSEKIMSALAELPEKYREVVTLRFMEELTVKETAKIMGVSEISVRVTQSRALRKLQKLLL